MVLPKLSKDPIYMLFTNDSNINRVKKIIKYKQYLDYKIEIYNYPNNYYYLIKLADIGIVSGGLTMFEFLSIGVPLLCLPQYRHQLLNIEKLSNQKLILQGSNEMYITKKFNNKTLIICMGIEETLFSKSRRLIDNRNKIIEKKVMDINYEKPKSFWIK